VSLERPRPRWPARLERVSSLGSVPSAGPRRSPKSKLSTGDSVERSPPYARRGSIQIDLSHFEMRFGTGTPFRNFCRAAYGALPVTPDKWRVAPGTFCNLLSANAAGFPAPRGKAGLAGCQPPGLDLPPPEVHPTVRFSVDTFVSPESPGLIGVAATPIPACATGQERCSEPACAPHRSGSFRPPCRRGIALPPPRCASRRVG
jgi:hypothetical protein